MPHTDDNERMMQGEPEGTARRERWARSRIFELPDLASADEVTARGDSIVDALTTEFVIEEVPAPRPVENPTDVDRTVALPAARAKAAASRNDEHAVGRRTDEEDGASEAAQADARASQMHDREASFTVSAATQAAVAEDVDADATAALPHVEEQPRDDDVSAGMEITAEEEEAYWSTYSAEDEPFETDYVDGPIGDDADGLPYGEPFDSPADTAVMEPIGDCAEPDITVERHRPRLHISAGKVVAVLCILLVLSLMGGGAAFAWDRWYRYDDVTDIQGEWQIANSQRTLVIDESNLKIDADVTYEYTIDPKAKTITYTFGDTTGTATYRFAKDRDTLIIDESMETDWLVALHIKSGPVLTGSDVPEGISKLKRLSHDTAAEPQTMGGNENDADEGAGDPFYVEGYTDLTQTEVVKPATGSDKDKDKDGEASEGEGSESAESDSEEQDANADSDAAYTDEETGMSYYFDDSQQLYYDMYGNYYYDMYGQNPYTAPTETYGDGTGLYDADTSYDDGAAPDGGGYY